MLNNIINQNTDKTKGINSGIDVFKLIKNSSHIDIENLNKVSDEIYQIDKVDLLDKKGANAKEILTGSDEVLKLRIMSSQGSMDKDSDERDQRGNDIDTDKLGIISSHSCINKNSDEIYQKDNDYETENPVIMSSQSCIDKDSDERYQRGNDIETEKLGVMSSKSCIDKYSNERDQRENDNDTEKNIAENDR